jgi:RNA ligase
MIPEFRAFEKIARLSRDIIITEKIDGTNGVIYIGDDYQTIVAGSRNRWITPGKQDNFGFAAWVEEYKVALIPGLGPGYHYGEWWGAGIGRRYGLAEKRFSLFNVTRWTDDVRPSYVGVVPTLYTGPFSEQAIYYALHGLSHEGSKAAPGFMQPEGVVIYHTASKTLFKKTLEGDERPKGASSDAG